MGILDSRRLGLRRTARHLRRAHHHIDLLTGVLNGRQRRSLRDSRRVHICVHRGRVVVYHSTIGILSVVIGCFEMGRSLTYLIIIIIDDR